MRFVLLSLVLFYFPGIGFAEGKIYRTTDSDGNVIFSDTASEEATEVEVQTPITFESTVTPVPQSQVRQRPQARHSYTKLAITSPDTASVRSNNGDLIVQFEVTPPLQADHSVQLLIDGTITHTAKSSRSISLSNVNRGTHQFQLQIIDDDSEVVLFSGADTSISILRHAR